MCMRTWGNYAYKSGYMAAITIQYDWYHFRATPWVLIVLESLDRSGMSSGLFDDSGGTLAQAAS